MELSPPLYYQKPTGKLWLANTQYNLVDAVETIVELDGIPTNFDDEIEDPFAHRITPGKQGFYDIKGQVAFNSVVALKNYLVSIRKNGVTELVRDYFHSSLADDIMGFVSNHVFLLAGDYIELYAASYSGDNTVDIISGLSRTFLSVQRVR